MSSDTKHPPYKLETTVGPHSLKTLVEPLAEYVTGTDDPGKAIAEVLSELVNETLAIERKAQHYLDTKRS